METQEWNFPAELKIQSCFIPEKRNLEYKLSWLRVESKISGILNMF